MDMMLEVEEKRLQEAQWWLSVEEAEDFYKRKGIALPISGDATTLRFGWPRFSD